MLLSGPTAELPNSPEWVYEPKLDGHRTLAYSDGPRLYSRMGRLVTDEFPEIAEQLPAACNGVDAALDGELVGVVDGLHQRSYVTMRRAQRILYVFDLLNYGGVELINQPLTQRRAQLETILAEQNNIRLVRQFDERDVLLDAARSLGLEGVVAKKKTSAYIPGKRSRSWLKYKFPEYRSRED